MVNEIAEGNKNGTGEDKYEPTPWTIQLGKYASYNPSPFKSKDDLIIKTIGCIFIIALGIYLLTIPNLAVQILGGLMVGSMLCCYILSIYETQLYDKRSRHELR